MAEDCSLPVPTRGDVYTSDGELRITNAAANIFVVYDRQSRDAARSPSSLSVEFVMGNVYLIDSAYLAPFKWGNTRLVGNLIKGLGLDLEGCQRGDLYIKTVYDDVVCVVGSERGAACSIGTVAGNLITVLNLSQVLGHPKPQNVAVSYIHGLKLYESHLAYGGGLHRAYSTWASMTFCATSRTSPTEVSELPSIKSGRVPSSTDNSTICEKHTEPEQRNLVRYTEQLKNIITSQEETLQKIADAKRQAAAAAKVVKLRKLGLLSLEKDFGSVGHSNHRQPSLGTPLICANCLRIGHEVRDCIGPVDAHGFIAACPLCNKKDHIYDHCPSRPKLPKSEKKAMNFEYLVLWRQNKAPMKSLICWIVAWARYECPRMTLPHTKTFALKMTTRKTAVASYPDWRTYRYPTSVAEVKSEHQTLPCDPDTLYDDGRECNLGPGSQSSCPGSVSQAVRKQMEQLGVRLRPEVQIPANSMSKRKKKKNKKNKKRTWSKTDGNNFATGDNCTIPQRPLPVAPSVHKTASVEIKQELED